MTLWAEIAKISNEVVNHRSQRDVYAHAVTEQGELMQEIIIAEGRSYKEAGEDGIPGEALDLILCMADLIIISDHEVDEHEEALRWFANGAQRAEGYRPQSLFSEALKDAKKSDDDIMSIMMDITMKTGEIARALSEPLIQDDILVSTAFTTMFDCVEMITLVSPEINEAGLIDLAYPKLMKWRDTAAVVRGITNQKTRRRP